MRGWLGFHQKKIELFGLLTGLTTADPGGDRNKFDLAQMPNMEGWSYRSQWWIRHIEDRTCLVARGAHGQVLYVDRANELVIARFGSSRKPASALLDPVLLQLIDLIVECSNEFG